MPRKSSRRPAERMRAMILSKSLRMRSSNRGTTSRVA
jgi:hypothetical protein